VYPKKQTRTTSNIQELIPLDSNFGFFVGAYLAEGCCCSTDGREASDDYHHHVLISNVDAAYQDRIKLLCKDWGCNWHMDERHDERGHTATVRIHSVVLATLMTRACGNGAPNKRFPPELLAANSDFLLGVLDGYFSGDGSVHRNGGEISASSVSRGLLEDMRQILLRFDITSSIRKQCEPKEDHHEQGHNLFVTSGNMKRFAELVHLTLAAKQERMEGGATIERMYEYNRHDVIPHIELSTGPIPLTHRDKVSSLIENTPTDNVDDIAILNRLLTEEIQYDQIVSIEEVPNAGRTHVYDLTVEGPRTFNGYDGMPFFDTFHLSGVANKGMQGVPRLKELMSVTKNIKTPCMEVHLDSAIASSVDAAKVLASDLQTTRFKDLVIRSRIYYDPEDKESRITDDRDLLDFYERFRALEVASAATAAEERRVSPWVLRFEFDRAKMLDLNVTMLDLEHTLSDWYDDLVRGTYSDDNAKVLLARIRLEYPAADDAREQDALTELKALEQSILEKVVVKGIPLVNKAAVEASSGALLFYDDATDAFVNRDDVKISTSGSNLVKVLSHDRVDSTKTSTNDVWEVYEVLGIEAARLCLFNELQSVMCIGDKNNVNYRHMALLVDVMTNRGSLQSIDRHGINRGETGPLAKCSFEETTDMLVKAGIFAELDRINGVSANIMLGQVAPCGTGDCEVLLDDVKMSELGVDVEIPVSFNMNRPDQEPLQQGQQGPQKEKGKLPEYVAPSADNRVQERAEDEIVII
jgi:hypothetical protein